MILVKDKEKPMGQFSASDVTFCVHMMYVLWMSIHAACCDRYTNVIWSKGLLSFCIVS